MSNAGFQLKITEHIKSNEKIQCEEIMQASEPDSNLMQILEWPDREFKIAMVHVLRTTKKKVSNIIL